MIRGRRRAVAGLVAAVFALGAVASEAACVVARHPVRSAEQAERAAADAVRARALSPIPIQCVSTQAAVEAGRSGHARYRVTFREVHSAACGGDPATAPRLFTVIVSSDGRMTTDAYGSDVTTGRFRALACIASPGAASGADAATTQRASAQVPM